MFVTDNWCVRATDSQERSDKMKEVRSKQLLCHTMSREGYARKANKWVSVIFLEVCGHLIIYKYFIKKSL